MSNAAQATQDPQVAAGLTWPLAVAKLRADTDRRVKDPRERRSRN